MVDMRFVVGCIVLLMHCCGALVVGNTSTVKCTENERLSLLSLKHVFGDPQGSLSSWGSAENQTDCCSWDHVYCDRRKSHVANSNATISYYEPDLGDAYVRSKDDFALLVWKGKVSKYQSTLGLVKSVDLSNNKFMGEIPIELMDLVGLVSLNISRNMLTGQIPTTIGQLKSLDVLDLSRNHLSGHIPSQLSQIDRLGKMDLSYNNLSGEIPHGTQLQSFDPSTYERNAHLCGAPLPECPTTTRPKQDHPSDEQFFTRGFFISLSLGFSTGFWGICSLIFLNKSFSYAYFRLVNDIYDKVYVVVAINMAKLRRWRRSAST